jgi:hypothetical protein
VTDGAVWIFEAGAMMACPGSGSRAGYRCNRPLGKVGFGLAVALRISPTGEPERGTVTRKCRSCQCIIEERHVAA